jgi:hypothetical protein
LANLDQNISRIEQIFEHTFTNKLLVAESLQMSGPNTPLYVNGGMHVIRGNKDLAVLGDSVLSTVLASIWYDHRDGQGTFLPIASLIRILR